MDEQNKQPEQNKPEKKVSVVRLSFFSGDRKSVV